MMKSLYVPEGGRLEAIAKRSARGGEPGFVKFISTVLKRCASSSESSEAEGVHFLILSWSGSTKPNINPCQGENVLAPGEIQP